MLADQLDQLAATERSASDALDAARAALEKARDAEAAANAKFDQSGDEEADLPAAARAQLVRVRAERVAAQRGTALETARAALGEAQTSAVRELLEARTRALAGWQDGLRAEVQELVELDEKLAGVVERVCARVADAEALHQEAAGLAAELGGSAPLTFAASWPSPKLEDAKFVAGVGIAVARALEGRSNALDGWLDSEPPPSVATSRQRWDRAAAIMNTAIPVA